MNDPIRENEARVVVRVLHWMQSRGETAGVQQFLCALKATWDDFNVGAEAAMDQNYIERSDLPGSGSAEIAALVLAAAKKDGML